MSEDSVYLDFTGNLKPSTEIDPNYMPDAIVVVPAEPVTVIDENGDEVVAETTEPYTEIVESQIFQELMDSKATAQQLANDLFGVQTQQDIIDQQAQEAWNQSVEALTEVQNSASILRIDSSRGVLFKQNTVSTVLSVTIFKGSQIINDALTLAEVYGPGAYLEWQWQRLNDLEFGTISSADPRIGSGGFTLTLTPADVDTKVVFRCILNGE